MNDQVITLAKNDDILKLHAKIEWADGRRIILIVPRGCRALDAAHEMQLLRRWADQADVQVALVSTSYTVQELGGVAGIPVFSSQEKAASTEWRWQRNVGEPVARRTTPFDDGAPQPRTPLLDRLGLAGWKLLLTLLLFGFAVVLLIGIASLLAPSASITIYPKSIVVSDAAEVILDPTVTTIDHINAIVPAGLYRKEISSTVTVDTSRTATAPADHATGIVTFNNLQGTEVTIPLGTIVATTSGATQRYSTTITATLPAGFNARVNVPVRALRAGPEGNVAPLQINLIEGPLSANARAVNLNGVGGGSIKDVKIVSFDDRRTAREKQSALLQDKAVAILKNAAEDNVYVVPASIEVIVMGEAFDHPVDDPSDTLTLKTDAVASGIFADYGDLETFANRRLLSKLPAGYTVLPGTLRVEADPNARMEANSVILKVRAALLATPMIDRAKILEGLNDLPVYQAIQTIAARVPQAKPPKIEITPSWWSRLPFFGFRTTLFVETQTK
ncbi:MAG: hypothetical protein DCC52_05235 [Chloroflexi bacterium]|nr:MAG: hypothetical protein DCC52_05235 [Chloroflexota bacterium]